MRYLLWVVGLQGIGLFTGAPSSARGFFVGFLEDYSCDALEFGTDAQHAFDGALFFGHGLQREEVDDLVHQSYVGAGAGVLRVLEDVCEEGYQS